MLESVQVGGAFAPPLKNLCRFLQENPEYGVPPEWADVVKKSVSIKVTHQIEALSLSLCPCAKANVRCMPCLQPRQRSLAHKWKLIKNVLIFFFTDHCGRCEVTVKKVK